MASSTRPWRSRTCASASRAGRRSGALGDDLLEQGHGPLPVPAPRVVQREVGADVLGAGGESRRPSRTRRGPAPRARARSGRWPGAGRRRGCRDPRPGSSPAAGSTRAYSSRTKREDALSRTSKRRAMSAGRGASLRTSGRGARADVAEARELPAFLLAEAVRRAAAPRATGADSPEGPSGAAATALAPWPRGRGVSPGSATTS